MLDSRTPLYHWDTGTINSQHYRDEILEAYARSLNPNSIEYVWDGLGKAVSQRSFPPRTHQASKDQLLEKMGFVATN
ncbi:hypothetical protein TNCV_867921 [Trichonephila clavipes]|nr:hypothetical protein TNCV_867921 [Trichonephila clavipes]